MPSSYYCSEIFWLLQVDYRIGVRRSEDKSMRTNRTKRFLFVENIDLLKEAKRQKWIIEHEVIADARFTGRFDDDPYRLSLWEFSDAQEGQERKLCLRLLIAGTTDINCGNMLPSENHLYHGGDVADEIIMLATLLLRRRLKLGPIVRRNEEPQMLKYQNQWLDKSLVVG